LKYSDDFPQLLDRYHRNNIIITLYWLFGAPLEGRIDIIEGLGGKRHLLLTVLAIAFLATVTIIYPIDKYGTNNNIDATSIDYSSPSSSITTQKGHHLNKLTEIPVDDFTSLAINPPNQFDICIEFI
jgi:hypothetical protein